MQKQISLLKTEKRSVGFLLPIVLATVVGIFWDYASITPALANNAMSSAYDGISLPGPVMNPSPVPCIGGEEALLIQDNVPWFAPANQDPLGANVTELKSQNKDFCIINSNQVGATNLNQFPEIIISAAQVQSFYNNLFPGGVIHLALTNYVQQGGVLTANLTDNASGPGAGGNWDGRTFIGGLTHTNDSTQNNDVAFPTHPIIVGQFGGANGGQIVDTASFQDLDNWNSASHGFFTNLPFSTRTILRDVFGRPVMVEYPLGNGVVIASQVTNEWRYAGNFGSLPQNKKLLANEIGYQDSFSKMINPTAAGELIRGFRPQNDPSHIGLDIDGDINGGTVFASAGGRVIRVVSVPDTIDPLLKRFGKWVWISHGGVIKRDGTIAPNISSLYLHMEAINPLLQEGTTIPRGTPLGVVDSTGVVTGPHLHFSVRQGLIPDGTTRPVGTSRDPLEFVDYDVDPDAAFFDVNSPVDIVLIDPDGFVVGKQVNELAGVARYVEVKYISDGLEIVEEEGKPEYDSIKIDERKNGDYSIVVVPEPTALPTDDFTLSVTSAGMTKIVAKDILISDIPDQPYIVRSTETTVEKIIPANVKIAPRTLNLGNKGLFSAIIEIAKGFGTSVKNIDPKSMKINGVPATRTIISKDKFAVAFFETQKLNNVAAGEKVKLKIVGKLKDGTVLEGTDVIRIIGKGKFSISSSSQLANALTALRSALLQLLELLEK